MEVCQFTEIFKDGFSKLWEYGGLVIVLVIANILQYSDRRTTNRQIFDLLKDDINVRKKLADAFLGQPENSGD